MNTVSTARVIAVEITNPLSRTRTEKSRAATRRQDPRSVSLGSLTLRTTSRNSSASVGRTGPNRTTSPDALARSSTRCSSTPAESSSTSPSGVVSESSHAGDRAVPSVGRTANLHEEEPPLPRGSQLLDRALRHDAAIVDQHDRVAEPLDQVELVAREHHRHSVVRRLSPQHPGEHVDARPGRGPRKARRARADPGSCTSAAASCTRCWLPSESASTRSPARPDTPSTSRISEARRRASGLGARAAARGTRAGRARASSGRGRVPRACSRSAGAPARRPARPATAPPGVGRRARRARYASPSSCRRRWVRRTRRSRLRGTVERDVVEGHDLAERSAQAGQLEHADTIGRRHAVSLGCARANVRPALTRGSTRRRSAHPRIRASSASSTAMAKSRVRSTPRPRARRATPRRTRRARRR